MKKKPAWVCDKEGNEHFDEVLDGVLNDEIYPSGPRDSGVLVEGMPSVQQPTKSKVTPSDVGHWNPPEHEN